VLIGFFCFVVGHLARDRSTAPRYDVVVCRDLLGVRGGGMRSSGSPDPNRQRARTDTRAAKLLGAGSTSRTLAVLVVLGFSFPLFRAGFVTACVSPKGDSQGRAVVSLRINRPKGGGGGARPVGRAHATRTQFFLWRVTRNGEELGERPIVLDFGGSRQEHLKM